MLCGVVLYSSVACCVVCVQCYIALCLDVLDSFVVSSVLFGFFVLGCIVVCCAVLCGFVLCYTVLCYMCCGLDVCRCRVFYSGRWFCFIVLSHTVPWCVAVFCTGMLRFLVCCILFYQLWCVASCSVGAVLPVVLCDLV